MFEEILSKIGAILKRHNIPYMIIGGQAVLLYGEPRLTRDIDITLGVDTGYIDELLAVVRELALKPIPENIKLFVQQTMVLPYKIQRELEWILFFHSQLMKLRP
jgi:hypothetical protein